MTKLVFGKAKRLEPVTRTSGTIEVSEADYREQRERMKALEEALRGAADWIEATADDTDDAAGAHTYAQNLRALADE